MAGAFPQRTALGPGALARNFIKSKSITSSMIDVSNLQAVAAKTGTLTVDGALTAGSGATTMAYDPAQGLFLGNAAFASAPFRVTPGGVLTATGAVISGAITANGGAIAGWTVSATTLSKNNATLDSAGQLLLGSGNNIIVMSATDATYRMWIGNAAGASAPFSVTLGGAIKSTSGTIGGLTVNTSDMTVGAGVKLKFGASALSYLDNALLHFDVTTAETGTVEFKNAAATTYYSQLLGMSDAAGTQTTIVSKALSAIGGRSVEIRAKSTGSDASTQFETIAIKSTGVVGGSYAVFADGTHSWAVDNGATGLDLSRTNRALTLYGRLYPGTGSASQASRYLFDNATEIESSGPFKVNTSMRLQGFTTGGTPQAFPTGASPTSVIMSTDVGATLLSIGVGYVTISIDGTNRKVLYVA